jgi:hypothetical protein
MEVFFFEKHQYLKFWWYFKVPQANGLSKFWQNVAALGKFGQFLPNGNG